MKLVLDITTEVQKTNILQLAQELHVGFEVLDVTEDEEDEAMVKAINAGAIGDTLSSEESAAFLAYLAR